MKRTKGRCALIIFSRIPEAGYTKTRMMPELSAEECRQLHICMLKDLAQTVSAIDADRFVYFTEAQNPKMRSKSRNHPGILKKIFGNERTEYRLQRGTDLGEKMHRAICEVLEEGYDSCVLIGSDIPEIQKTDLETAFFSLQTMDVVFGPTPDGGYYLVGMNSPHPEVFDRQTYGTGTVLEETENRIRRENPSLLIGRIHEREDLDVPSDLKAFRNRIRQTGRPEKSHTMKWLTKNRKISVIVPIYNEEKTILPMLAQLNEIKDQAEILLVDGGSQDRTLELIQKECPSGITLIHSPKGRANQMNLGAEQSHGEILFFLHCDSELPKHALKELREVNLRHRAGCFGIAFHSCRFFLWTCRVISNHRVFDRKVMFGDQGIFLDRDLFFEAGMFPVIPIMEDYQFSLTLKEMQIPLGMTRHRIYTSARRFPKRTMPMLKEMWKMNRLRKMYRDGVPVEVLDRLYRDVR